MQRLFQPSSWHAAWDALAGVELTPENGRSLYVPEGCAHGFQTLADDTEVLYQISCPWHSASGRGARWNDPQVGIPWPVAEAFLSERDLGLPLLEKLS